MEPTEQIRTAPPHAATLAGRDISFSFAGAPVLENVSVAIAPGRVTAILGPNGSGKSTLLHVLLGYLKPRAGAVLLDNRPLGVIPAAELAATIAFTPQTPAVAFAYTVEEIVLMGRWPLRNRRRGGGSLESLLGAYAPADRAAARDAMWRTDVHHLADRTFNELSGGERQRVVLARALAQDAPIILMDEPTASLDMWHQLELLHRLGELAHRQGRAVGWVAHELNLARQFSDQIILLHGGRVAATGAPEAVLTSAILEPIYRVRVRMEGKTLTFARREENSEIQ